MPTHTPTRRADLQSIADARNAGQHAQADALAAAVPPLPAGHVGPSVRSCACGRFMVSSFTYPSCGACR